MTSTLRRALTVAATAAAAAAALAIPATPAFAINDVDCGNRTDLLRLTLHHQGRDPVDRCFANAGRYNLRFHWLHKIQTGGNRVQWYGDGRWQPATPIGKWTTYTFPNHPGGVSIEEIRIL